jgi:hypothetical protein
MKNIEQQLEDEKRRSQAIIDLLDEALVKISLDPNSYTVAGKIDMLLKYAQQSVQADVLEWCGCEGFTPTKENGKCSACGKNAHR